MTYIKYNYNTFSDFIGIILTAGVSFTNLRIMMTNFGEETEIWVHTNCILNPINPGLLALELTLGGGVFHPPSITLLSLKLDCSNFAQSYFQIG